MAQEPRRPVKVLETGITEEGGQTELQVFRGLAPFHPEQVEEKANRAGREEQGSSLESTSETDEEFPGNHGSSVPDGRAMDVVAFC